MVKKSLYFLLQLFAHNFHAMYWQFVRNYKETIKIACKLENYISEKVWYLASFAPFPAFFGNG